MLDEEDTPTEMKQRKKWKCYVYTLMCFSFVGPILVLFSWYYILLSNGWTCTTAAVSRVISTERVEFYLMLVFTIPGILMITLTEFIRNLQIHVYFVNDSDTFTLCWRYLNLISIISYIIAISGLILMFIFNSTDYPIIHIVCAGVLVLFLFISQIFHGILTLKQRDVQYRNNNKNCKTVFYFIECIWYICVAVIGFAGTVVYVILYQTSGVNITDKGNGITYDYYIWQWIGVSLQLIYSWMFVFTVYFDEPDDEMQL
eukprot:59743_1